MCQSAVTYEVIRVARENYQRHIRKLRWVRQIAELGSVKINLGDSKLHGGQLRILRRLARSALVRYGCSCHPGDKHCTKHSIASLS